MAIEGKASWKVQIYRNMLREDWSYEVKVEIGNVVAKEAFNNEKSISIRTFVAVWGRD